MIVQIGESLAPHVEVRLDGALVDQCVFADSDSGYVLTGSGGWVPTRRDGAVEITLKRDATEHARRAFFEAMRA